MRRLWITLGVIVVFGFAVLGWIGTRIYQEMPPIPDRVVTTDGREVVGPGEIMRGQGVWQTMGGMEIGSVWGHGSYVAPDWTADWLHRESVLVLNAWATAEHATSYNDLDPERRASLRARLRLLLRTTRFDRSTGVLAIDPVRAQAFAANAAYYAALFRDGRPEYAIPARALTDPSRLRALAAFFFWTAWAAATERPGTRVSYTSNWPY